MFLSFFYSPDSARALPEQKRLARTSRMQIFTFALSAEKKTKSAHLPLPLSMRSRSRFSSGQLALRALILFSNLAITPDNERTCWPSGIEKAPARHSFGIFIEERNFNSV